MTDYSLNAKDYNHQRKRIRAENLQNFVTKKFGVLRGAKSRAAETCGISIQNFSPMLSGSTSIPDRVFEILEALPDHTPEALPEIITPVVATLNGWRVIADIDIDTHNKLVRLGKLHNRGQAVDLNDPHKLGVLITWCIDAAYKTEFEEETEKEALDSVDPLS